MYDRLTKLIERLDWPVFTLEMRRAKRSEKSFLYVLLIAAGLSVACTLLGVYGAQSGFFYALIAMIQILRVLFALAVVMDYGAKTIAGEREMQRFENLALTSLESREIILQKAAMPVMYLFAITIVLLPADIALVFAAEQTALVGWQYMWLPIWFVAASMFNLSVAILCSCFCSKARTASTLSAIVLVGGVMLLFPVTLFLVTVPFGPLAVVVLALIILVLATQRLETLRRSC